MDWLLDMQKTLLGICAGKVFFFDFPKNLYIIVYKGGVDL